MKKSFSFLISILLLLSVQILFAQANVKTSRENYNTDEIITVYFSGGPGNSTDWVGIYKYGEVPSNTPSILWNYVNGSQVSTTSKINGMIDFPSGLAEEGQYWVGFFDNDSYNIMVADSFTVENGHPRVGTDTTVYDVAAPITAYFKNGPNNSTDWVGIYKDGDVPGDQYSILWYYVNGSQTSTVGQSEGILTFEEGLINKGKYWIGFFENDGYTILDSVGFWVTNLSDTIPPAAPSINVTTSNFTNLVTWTDIADEEGETYSVYISSNPIIDVNGEGVELVKSGIYENTQVFEHFLRSANIDRTRTYYYAVTCQDLSGNIGSTGTFGPVTNNAKKTATVSVNPPNPFAADGNLSEWDHIVPFIMVSDSGTANVPSNSTVTNDLDLSASVKVAVDNEYLYVSMDVTDDVFNHPMELNSWERDEPDLYIGLYNLTKVHSAYGTGSKADYQLRFDKDRVVVAAVEYGDSLLLAGENYYNEEKLFPPGYIIEAKISINDIATKRNNGSTANDTIDWNYGDKIPFDIGINDNDGSGREGMIFYSSTNQDQGYNNVSTWTYTWIGDEVTGIEENGIVKNNFELMQNYPNPFNPSTKINYSLSEPGFVNLIVYDILGSEVETIVNSFQQTGNYSVIYNANNLTSGIYLIKLEAGSFSSVRKMMLLK
jgi:hypothetical protein